jgi:site-specific recombinase XerD
MLKSETLGHYLNKYLAVYLPGQRGLSTNTILSYRDAFSLFIMFLKEIKRFAPERLTMSFLTRELIVEYADWLENERKSSRSSRNHRLVVLRAFCKWLATDNPAYLKLSEDICSMRVKKAPKPVMAYLSVDAMSNLLSLPDSSTKNGLRDLTLLALTYDTGARVTEIVNLRYKDIRFISPPIVRITGKGNKTRIVPLLPQTVRYLKEYMSRFETKLEDSQDLYVFTNHRGEQLTRAGVAYILGKYVADGRSRNPTFFPDKVSPHTLRHSKAMHMLQANNNIVYIRDILGHEGLNTTERYARADTSMKREALQKAEILMPVPVMEQDSSPLSFLNNNVDKDMENWLKSLGKNNYVK